MNGIYENVDEYLSVFPFFWFDFFFFVWFSLKFRIESCFLYIIAFVFFLFVSHEFL